MTDPNTALMQSIHDNFGSSIVAASQTSTVPPEFLAALIANESGGRPDAKRFEPGVLASLWAVLQGRAAAFGSIGRADLFDYIVPQPADFAAAPSPRGQITVFVTGAMQRLDSLATSWGLTQIMGYEGIALGCEPSAFTDPAQELRYTCRMLAQFGQRFLLDLGKDFDEMFRCWNAGRPHAVTADPFYSKNGLARLAIYKGFLPSPAGPEKAMSA